MKTVSVHTDGLEITKASIKTMNDGKLAKKDGYRVDYLSEGKKITIGKVKVERVRGFLAKYKLTVPIWKKSK